MLPVIFIFDLDETLIGKASPINDVYEFRDFLVKAKKAGKLPMSCKLSRVSRADMYDRHPHFLRPHAIDFIHAIKDKFPTAELYVYSAGTREYVTDSIKWVEKEANMQFNRPIMARDNTITDSQYGYTMKSITYLIDMIIQSLESKYPALKNEKNRAKVLESRIMMIDDNPTVMWDGPEKMIGCPHYTYTPVEDMTAGLDASVLTIPEVSNYLRDAAFVPSNDVAVPEENMAAFHVHMFQKYQSVIPGNKAAIEDTFFAKLLSALRPLSKLKRPFTTDRIAKINKAMAIDT